MNHICHRSRMFRDSDYKFKSLLIWAELGTCGKGRFQQGLLKSKKIEIQF